MAAKFLGEAPVAAARAWVARTCDVQVRDVTWVASGRVPYLTQRLPTTNMMEDNSAALKWCYNPINHSKQKHIPVAYHFVREQVAQFDNVNIVAIGTDWQLADLFTKCLPVSRMRFLVETIQGLNPALPPKSKVQQAKEALDSVAEVAKELFDLKKMLKDQASQDDAADVVTADEFFEQHFKEADPNSVPEMREHEN